MSASPRASRLLWQALFSRPLLFCAAVFSSLLNKAADVLPEVLIGVAIHIVTQGGGSFFTRFGLVTTKQQLMALGGLTALIWGAESFFQYWYMIFWGRIAQGTQHELRVRTYKHLQQLPMKYFGSARIGRLTTIINDDINQLAEFLKGDPNSGINGFIQLVSSTIMIGAIFFWISPHIALCALLPVPLVIISSVYFKNRIAQTYGVVREQASGIASVVSHNITGMLMIKSFLTGGHEAQRVHGQSEQYRDKSMVAVHVAALFVPVTRMLILGGFIYVLVKGGFMVLDGEIAISSYSMLIFLTQRLIWPFMALVSIVDSYEKTMAALRRITTIFDEKVDPVYEAASQESAPLTGDGEVVMRDVTFGYDENQPVLNNLGVSIAGKRTTAFVGATGSGKSTVVKLLLRLFSSKTGNIMLDGTDITQIPVSQLRAGIGYVGQESFLVPGTLAENISYGCFGATQAQIEQAAKDALIHDFIESLPDGYQTVIDERGQRLSGGQRQRIAIARALVRDPKILILDEATSALDNSTEAGIIKTLEQLQHSRTIIMIAHRLASVQHADMIVALDKGQVAEQGSHSELVARNGLYAKLWQSQS